MHNQNLKKATLGIHGRQKVDPFTGAVITPVYLSSTFKQSAPNEHQGYDYSRAGNPTRDAYEDCIASLENGDQGFAFSSGLAATATIVDLLPAGSHIISSDDLYGGSFRLFDKVRSKSAGLELDFVNLTKGDLVRTLNKFKKTNTKMLWLESPSNPLLKLADLEVCAKWAKENNIIAVCDNTFASPILQNPLDLGYDLVVHSATKYIGGHSDVVGGMVVTAKGSPLSEQMRFLQMSVGAIASPFDSMLAHRGAKTLALRMEKHCDNAMKIANWLEQHPKVAKIYYPGLESHPQHELAKRQMRNFGGMISFEITGSSKDAKQFVTNTKLFTLAESLGGVESLLEQPSTMTHASIPESIRAELGITDQLIRLSVGIEDASDLINDLDQALQQVGQK
ncbi:MULTISPECIES: trans-sulfuration enzyme family protein [unclassified Francisella]|uniref:trans-sulfuration enzyme family protein n=1 Tax=unclassified Francisella TaxID=2610885 RepID=UPI002E317D8C|nr:MULTISPECIES: PLP-dependent aspartate aminotransferase family protein [unclassified Francisella]MED7818382.1 PLP-dependent aspartate aminotransferase family protein [Francisella sp. 19S2-4]MED7829218.1 PLP-dependent aspartate aminotransferase family protein [Francisella sp. 19S2-10]